MAVKNMWQFKSFLHQDTIKIFNKSVIHSLLVLKLFRQANRKTPSIFDNITYIYNEMVTSENLMRLKFIQEVILMVVFSHNIRNC